MSKNTSLYALCLLVGLLLGIVVEAKLLGPLSSMRGLYPDQSMNTNTVSPVVANTVEPAKLQVTGAKYDFGRRECGEIVRHTFVLRNEGGSPLRLGDIKPGCGCTTAAPSRSVILPGKEATLDVRLNLAKQKGHQRKHIMVESNDPDNPVFRLALVGEAVSRIVMTPEHVKMGEVPAAELTVKTVEVRAVDGLSVNVQQVKTSGADISAEYEVLEAGKAWRIRVQLDPSVSKGLVRGWVQLITDHPGEYKVIGIPISARVQSESSSSQANLGG